MPDHVYRIIQVAGSSQKSIEDAIQNAVGRASSTLRQVGWFEVVETRGHVEDGGVAHYQVTLKIGFTLDDVLQNLLLGRHVHKRTRFVEELLFLPKVRQFELEHRAAAERVIDFLDLQPHRDSLIVNLPFGVRKVVELARALCTEPKLLLLDEPSSGLNVEETDDMAFWIQDIRELLGVTVLMVEHDMRLVSAVSDRVLALDYGRLIAAGTPSEVQAGSR